MRCIHCRELKNKYKAEKRSWTAVDGVTISTYFFRLERIYEMIQTSKIFLPFLQKN